MNKEVISINQDPLGKQAELNINNSIWTILLKPLENGDYALGILNRSDVVQSATFHFANFGLDGKYEIRDLWQHKVVGRGDRWSGDIELHETKLFRLKRLK